MDRDGSEFIAARGRPGIDDLPPTTSRGIRLAVLGAVGSGPCGNPAAEVAPLYREQQDLRRADFALGAFAIFDAGYGPDSVTERPACGPPAAATR